MGYSCTKSADDTLKLIGKTFATDGNPNILTINGKLYFFERGREQSDGAITGVLFFTEKDSPWASAVGSVRINADGTIARFPRIPGNVKTQLSLKATTYDHHGDLVTQ